jgi:putative flippase GtrA
MISLREFRPNIFLRFLVVGIVNTCFGIGVYWLLLYAGFYYQWASLLSLLLGIIFSFNSHRAAVFRTEGRFFCYVLIWAFIYFINIEIISILREYIGDYIAGIVLAPINATLSFLLMKRFVFQSKKYFGFI